MREQGIGKAELARRLSWHPPQVDRVLDVRHKSRLDQMESAAPCHRSGLGDYMSCSWVREKAVRS